MIYLVKNIVCEHDVYIDLETVVSTKLKLIICSAHSDLPCVGRCKLLLNMIKQFQFTQDSDVMVHPDILESRTSLYTKRHHQSESFTSIPTRVLSSSSSDGELRRDYGLAQGVSGRLLMVDPEKCRDRRYCRANDESVISPLASFCEGGHQHGLREFLG